MFAKYNAALSRLFAFIFRAGRALLLLTEFVNQASSQEGLRELIQISFERNAKIIPHLYRLEPVEAMAAKPDGRKPLLFTQVLSVSFHDCARDSLTTYQDEMTTAEPSSSTISL